MLHHVNRNEDKVYERVVDDEDYEPLDEPHLLVVRESAADTSKLYTTIAGIISFILLVRLYKKKMMKLCMNYELADIVSKISTHHALFFGSTKLTLYFICRCNKQTLMHTL